MVAGWESRGFLGVGVSDIDSERAKALKLKEEYGVQITRVDEDSSAEHAGLKAGDVVLAYNGQRVEGTEQFIRMVRETPTGRTVTLTIVRDGAQQNVQATLGARKAPSMSMPDLANLKIEMPDFALLTPDVPRAMMSWRSGLLGIEAEALGETQLGDYFGVGSGVLVRNVMKGTAAEKAGMKAGDVLMKVDTTQVGTPRDVSNAIREARGAGKKTLPLMVMRNHKETTLQVTFDDASPATPKVRGSVVKHQD